MIERFWKPSRAKRGMWEVGPPLNNRTISRLRYFDRLLGLAPLDRGTVLECGVGAGDSLLMLQGLLADRGYRGGIVACDSFQGLPHSSDPRGRAGDYAYSVEYIRRLLRARGHVALHAGTPDARENVMLWPGWFHETLPLWLGAIAFLHLDCDLAESYSTCLVTLTPHLVSGAVIAIDDYNETWPGCISVLDGWCGAKGWTIQQAGPWHFVIVP